MTIQYEEIGLEGDQPVSPSPEQAQAFELTADNLRNIRIVEENRLQTGRHAVVGLPLELLDAEGNRVPSMRYEGFLGDIDERNRALLDDVYQWAGADFSRVITLGADSPRHEAVRRYIPINGIFVQELTIGDARQDSRTFSVSVLRRDNVPREVRHQWQAQQLAERSL